MKQRGRKPGGTGLTVIEGDFSGKRPDPPADLKERQREIWTAIVNDEPLQHFATKATQLMLRNYCLHIAMAEGITQTISQFPQSALKSEKGLRHLQGLLRARDIEVRAATTLATKLRMTNQSRYSEKTAHTASQNTLKGIKPWDWEK